MRFLTSLAMLVGLWLTMPTDASAWWPHYHPNCCFNPYVYHRPPPCYWYPPGWAGPNDGCGPVGGVGPPPFRPGCGHGCNGCFSITTTKGGGSGEQLWPTMYRSPRDFFMRDLSKN